MEEASAMEKIDLLQYICFSFFSSKQELGQVFPIKHLLFDVPANEP